MAAKDLTIGKSRDDMDVTQHISSPYSSISQLQAALPVLQLMQAGQILCQ